MPRCLPLLLILLVAACAPKPRPAPAAPAPVATPGAAASPAPKKPAWKPAKVVPDGVAVPGGRLHTVKAGETGLAIAQAYGVAWSKVVAANRLAPPYTLEIGQKLLLPAPPKAAPASVEARAAAFKVDIDDLLTGSEPAARAAAPAVAAGGTTVALGAAAATTPRPAPAPGAPAAPAIAAAAPRFAWPVEGRILSGFGPKPGGRYNDGINIKAGRGDAVRAADAGTVAYAGDAIAGFGNLLLIKHAGGWVTAYAHNETLLVERGDTVGRGEVIARAGATGAVSEPQLHFEVRRGRTPVDPVKLLPPRG